uniref:RING-type E3 ubiquitin transferase n=1 Tax=Coccolithus braarudii TaxID=221442 RepID=A0A7S0Q3G5_9EUKA
MSAFPANSPVPKLCFSDISGPSVESDLASLRMALQLEQRALKAIVTELLKNPAAKEPLFKLIAGACRLNQVRQQQYFPINETQRLFYSLDPQRSEPPSSMPTASSDGFMINLTATLLHLCEPFMAPNSPHAAKIDASYLLSTHRLALETETRLCATADEALYWLQPSNADLRRRYVEKKIEAGEEPEAEGMPALAVSTSFGTISEYFFLTMRLMHLGILSALSVFGELARNAHMTKNEQELRETELQRLRLMGSGAPSALVAQMQAEVARYSQMNEAISRFLLCYQAQLLDPSLLSLSLRYYRLVSRWLVATANPPPEGLPLPHDVPRLFAALPEFCLDDVANFLKHLTNFAPQVLEQLQPDELHDYVTLMVTFIASPRYVKNPYLRATFTKLLRFLVPRSEDSEGRGSHGSERLAAIFHTHALAKKHLAPALMQFFVDIEFTGSHSAHDKYEFRHEMTQILEYLWTLPEYHAAMVGFTRETASFVRFINMLINDSIYSMDEALTKLASIHKTQLEMADEARWNSQGRQQVHQRLQTLQQEETYARYFMQFTNEVQHMMKYLSSEPEVAPVFMLPELAGRIASMLNYFLVQLVGANSKQLKVKNPEKYLFNPAKLLLTVCTVIIHFAPLPEFGQAVVKDDRSFDPSNMRKALKVLSQKMSIPHESLEVLDAFCAKCVALKQQGEEEEAELGEVPEEFLCEITMEIMEEPTLLPSGKVVDRKNICRHLLSDETDPYSRQRLTVEMLTPDHDMKARIAAFRASRKKAAAGSSNQPMELG